MAPALTASLPLRIDSLIKRFRQVTAVDGNGFTKVFWRREPVSNLWPQVLVLLTIGVVPFAIAHNLAQCWDYT